MLATRYLQQTGLMEENISTRGAARIKTTWQRPPLTSFLQWTLDETSRRGCWLESRSP
jgi:hypothetical protein